MCTTLFLRDISACNCVAKTTVDQGDYPKVIPKAGLLLNYKTSEYPLIKEVFSLVIACRAGIFCQPLPCIIFLDSPQLSVSLNVQIDRTAPVYTLLTLAILHGRSQSLPVVQCEKRLEKVASVCVAMVAGKDDPLKQAIRFHINLPPPPPKKKNHQVPCLRQREGGPILG